MSEAKVCTLLEVASQPQCQQIVQNNCKTPVTVTAVLCSSNALSLVEAVHPRRAHLALHHKSQAVDLYSAYNMCYLYCVRDVANKLGWYAACHLSVDSVNLRPSGAVPDQLPG